MSRWASTDKAEDIDDRESVDYYYDRDDRTQWRETHPSTGWVNGVYAPLDDEEPWSMAMPFESGASFVYFIHAPEVGRVKIGVTTDIEGRMASMQTGSPVRLRLVKLIRGDRNLEQRLHHLFDAKRIEGEWFYDSVLTDYITIPTIESHSSEATVETK